MFCTDISPLCELHYRPYRQSHVCTWSPCRELVVKNGCRTSLWWLYFQVKIDFCRNFHHLKFEGKWKDYHCWNNKSTRQRAGWHAITNGAGPTKESSIKLWLEDDFEYILLTFLDMTCRFDSLAGLHWEHFTLHCPSSPNCIRLVHSYLVTTASAYCVTASRRPVHAFLFSWSHASV